jgi:hypothetical protein
MRWRYVFYMVGILLIFLGGAMLMPLAAGWWFKDTERNPSA